MYELLERRFFDDDGNQGGDSGDGGDTGMEDMTEPSVEVVEPEA